MLKHATINRTSRAQQTLQLQGQRQCGNQATTGVSDAGAELVLPAIRHSPAQKANDDQNNNDDHDKTLIDFITQAASPPPPSSNGHPSPSPSLLTSPVKSPLFETLTRLESTPSSPFCNNTLAKSSPISTQSFKSAQSTLTRPKYGFGSESVIKVYAQTLSQEVEYITLHVNTQTKSQQIVKSLLKKFRLKHRDPNLFYLTLERWIRKDGLKFKSVMLLGDEACPLQLQQCCSNPPHNDIKFTLQMRAGALVKIFCSDVLPDTHYKCLSLSSQTTVDETIELMLHCLNIVTPNATNNHPTTMATATSNMRLNGSPSPTSSSASSNSSSSGIESEPNNHHHTSFSSPAANFTSHHRDQLDSDSRTSSVTSISSTSNVSNISNSIIDQYCIVIECADRNFKRMLEPDEYLVDVYQNLVREAKSHINATVPSQYLDVVNGNLTMADTSDGKHQLDQWFFIKLMRRNDYHHQTIKFTHPRQNLPLPPIPLSLPQLNNANNLHNIVSTTQIEVNCRPGSRLAVASNKGVTCKQHSDQAEIPTRAPPPPALIILPPVRPRRRNLSNATSTFVRPSSSMCNRRRYDPAQLADDLSKLNVKEVDASSPVIDEKQSACPMLNLPLEQKPLS